MKGTNHELIERINAYQESGCFHPLTCGIDSRHGKLLAREADGSVILVCSVCGTIQEHVPELFTNDDFYDMTEGLSQRMGALIEEDQERRK